MLNYKQSKFKSGFTMIELMMAVVVISIGLVFILRSLNSALFGLSHVQNQYFAARIAREKLEELEEKIIMENAVDEESGTEKINFRGRTFQFTIEVTPQVIDIGKFPQILPKDEEDLDYPQVEDALYLVKTRVEWMERGNSRELVLATYLESIGQ